MAWTMPRPARLLRAELNDGSLVAELKPLLSPSPEAAVPGIDKRERMLAGVGNDVRQALRLLRFNPGFAAVAILSLALGIGANTAIFELIDAVLMRTLPVPSPQQLADIQEIHGGRIGSTVARQKEFSFAIWDQLRQQQKAFSGIAAWSTERFDLGQGGEARYAEGMWVSGSFFQVLQVQPMLGRLIAESDDYRGCGVRGAVISNAFWQREFGGRSNVIGSKLSLDGHPFEILGVTPPSYYGLEVGRNFDVALPLCSEPVLHGEGAWTADSTTWWLAAIGRLKAGWSFKQASAQLSGVAPGIFAATLPARVRRGGQEGLSAVFLAGRARSHGRFTAAKAICSPAVGAAFHLWTGLVDCVRKPGQPDAGQGRCAAARDGFAADAWGLAPAADPAVAGGEPAACAERCSHRHRAGPRAGQGSDCIHWQHAGSCFSSHLPRSSGSVVHVWSGAVDLRAVWSGARDPGGQCRSRDGDEGKRTRVDRGTRTLPAAQRADRFAGCALSGAAGGGPACLFAPSGTCSISMLDFDRTMFSSRISIFRLSRLLPPIAWNTSASSWRR